MSMISICENMSLASRPESSASSRASSGAGNLLQDRYAGVFLKSTIGTTRKTKTAVKFPLAFLDSNSSSVSSSTASMSIKSGETPKTAENPGVCAALSGFYPFRKRCQSRLASPVSSVMDDRYRGALQRHYRLLMMHITLTDDIITQMASMKILSETMIKDIKAGETKEERNEALLNALRLRGNTSYKRFRELMYRTGNFFVADLLWEDDDNTSPMVEDDISSTIPGFLVCVKEEHRKKLVQYLEAKVREKALLLAWQEAPRERMEALHKKAAEYNQERVCREIIMKQEEKVKELEAALTAEKEEVCNLKVEVQTLNKQIVQIKRDHRSSLDNQTRYHNANASTIVRLTEKMSAFRTAIKRLNGLVCSQLDDPPEQYVDDDTEDIKLPVLEQNIIRLQERMKHEEEQIQNHTKQREEVLKLVNRRSSKESLVSVVKDVLRHEQKHRAIVMKDIMKLTDILKPIYHTTTTARSNTIDPATLDTKIFKAQLAMLKAEAEHVQKRLAWKDSEICRLRSELSSYVQSSENIVISPSESSVASSYEMSPFHNISPCGPNPSPSTLFATIPSHSQGSFDSSDKSLNTAGMTNTPLSSSHTSLATPKAKNKVSQITESKAKNPLPKTANSKGNAERPSSNRPKSSGGHRKSITLAAKIFTANQHKGKLPGPEVESSSRDLDETLVDAEKYLNQEALTLSSADAYVTGGGDV